MGDLTELDNLFVAQYQTRWHETSHELVAEANAELKGWEAAYYAANVERLRAVKSRYDPANLFSFARSVPLPG